MNNLIFILATTHLKLLGFCHFIVNHIGMVSKSQTLEPPTM